MNGILVGLLTVIISVVLSTIINVFIMRLATEMIADKVKKIEDRILKLIFK